MRIIEAPRKITESLFKRINGIHYRLISYPVHGMNEGLHFCMLEGYGIFESWARFFDRYSFKLRPYGSVILQGARATAAPFIDQETMKAVLSQTLDQSKRIIRC